MAGGRAKIARAEREAARRRIVAWIGVQTGTKQALCKRLKVNPSQLHALVHDGVERFSLEYLLDLWQRCGGSFSLVLEDQSSRRARQPVQGAPAPSQQDPGPE